MKLYPSDGTAKFKELMNNALSVVEYRIERALEKVDVTNDAGKIRFLETMRAYSFGCYISVEREVYAGRLSDKYSVSRTRFSKWPRISVKEYRKKDKATNRQNHSSENRGHGKQGQA